MNATMRAVVLRGHGGLDQLEYHDDWPKPTPARGEVLLRIGACGLNNTDVNTRTAWYSREVTSATGEYSAGASGADAGWGGSAIKFPRIQGADAVGVVEELGADTPAEAQKLIGRRVMLDCWLRRGDGDGDAGYFGSDCDGGFAEFTTIDWQQAHAVESDLTDAELATFATSYTTAENMLRRAKVGDGDRVLITGASGGVGSALIQLTNRRGAQSIAMCAPEKIDALRELGAHACVSRAVETLDDLRGALRDASGHENVNVVADVVGGEHWGARIDALARGGRYTCAGAIAGPVVEFDLRPFYLRDLIFTGATVAPPEVFANLVGYIERGEIRPLLAAEWPLKELREAQRAFMKKRHIGNIVVRA